MEEEEQGETVGEFTGAECDWYDLPCHMTSFAEWLVGILLYLPRVAFSAFADAAEQAIGMVSLPSGLQNGLTPFFTEAGPGAVWVADLFAVGPGFTMLFAAVLVRFTLRALPWVF